MLVHVPLDFDFLAGDAEDWSMPCASPYRSMPGRRKVARLQSGTPLREGVTPHSHPEVTAEHRAQARDAWYEWSDRHGSIGTPPTGEALDGYVEAALGVAHWLSEVAPWGMTPGEADDALARARELWDTRCSVAVIRAAVQGGYDVWRGVGSTMQRAGWRDMYDAAEELAVDFIMERRTEVMRQVNDILAGWEAETPFVGDLTIDEAAAHLPWCIRRGPVTAAEAGPSWDLPVVLERRGDIEERYDERVTWDDEESREGVRRRKREADEKRLADEREAVRRLVALGFPAANGRQLAQATAVGGDGVAFTTLGPVRMYLGDPQALATWNGRRTWMGRLQAVTP